MPRKIAFGPWLLPVFGVLAKMKGLRGTPFDPFGWTEERRMERRLLADYEARIETLLPTLDHDNHALAVEIASLPQDIRGYGHIKHRNAALVAAQEQELVARYLSPQGHDAAA